MYLFRKFSPAKPFRFPKFYFFLKRASITAFISGRGKITAWPIGEMHLTVEGFLLFKQSLSKFSFFVIRDPSYESKENKKINETSNL